MHYIKRTMTRLHNYITKTKNGEYCSKTPKIGYVDYITTTLPLHNQNKLKEQKYESLFK